MPSSAHLRETWGTGSAARDAGFNNFPDFLQAHGLSITIQADIEEGKEILRSMGYNIPTKE